jgi:hypothetical protein
VTWPVLRNFALSKPLFSGYFAPKNGETLLQK